MSFVLFRSYETTPTSISASLGFLRHKLVMKAHIFEHFNNETTILFLRTPH